MILGDFNSMLSLIFSEQEKVKSYHQKISKWQGQVSERLQVLSRRAGLGNFALGF